MRELSLIPIISRTRRVSAPLRRQHCCAVRALELPEFPELHLTISVGGVHGQGRVRDLILQADTALYKAKIKKDCVVVYEEDANEAE